MKIGRSLAVTITVFAVGLAVARIVWPSLNIDLVTVVFLVLAAIPWMLPVLKSLEFPGGIKIELRDVQAAARNIIEGSAMLRGTASVKAEGTIIPRSAQELKETLGTLKEIARVGHEIGLVALRIEIEKRLRRIAEARGVAGAGRSAGYLIQLLVKNEILPEPIATGLQEFIRLGNSAAHGADVEPAAADWAMENADAVLNALESMSQLASIKAPAT